MPTLLAGLCALALASPVQAAKYRVVSRFKGEGFTHSSAVPLIQGTNGAIWGTTPRGSGYGQIFWIFPYDNTPIVLAPLGQDKTIKYPQGGLMLGGDGLYYGVTEPLRNPLSPPRVFAFNGDSYRFEEVTPLVEGWKTSAPPIWAPEAGDNPGGSVPMFYGVASDSRGGVVFRQRSGQNLETLADLKPASTGSDPLGPLRLASDGKFYGTASSGGQYAQGTVFSIQASPAPKITKIYDFCRDATCGGTPNGPLALGWDGALYGTTQDGGNQGHGTVFRIQPGQPAQFIHSFDDKNQGWKPSTGLVLGSNGKLYGTTSTAGPNDKNCGTIFSLSPDYINAPTTWTFKVEHAFNGNAGCAPISQPMVHSNGRIYGMTAGPAKALLYELDVGAKPAVVPVQQGAQEGTAISLLGQGLSNVTSVTIGRVTTREFRVVNDTYMTVVVPEQSGFPVMAEARVTLNDGSEIGGAAPVVILPIPD